MEVLGFGRAGVQAALETVGLPSKRCRRRTWRSCERRSRRSWEGTREKTAQLVDPDVEFHGTVGGLQEGEIAHGQTEIDQRFESQDLEAWEERRLEAEEFIDAGDAVVVLLHEFRRGRKAAE